MQVVVVGYIGQFVYMVEGYSLGGSLQQIMVVVCGDGDGVGCDCVWMVIVVVVVGMKQVEVEKWYNELVVVDFGMVVVWCSYSEQEVMYGIFFVYYSVYCVFVYVVYCYDCCFVEDKGCLGDYILKGLQRVEVVEGCSCRMICLLVFVRRERV